MHPTKQRERDPLYFSQIVEQPPSAIAQIKGTENQVALSGWIRFYQTAYGVVISAEIWGLPATEQAIASFPFQVSRHTLPPLPATQDGYTYLNLLSDYFTVKDILGSTVTIHNNAQACAPIGQGTIVTGKTVR